MVGTMVGTEGTTVEQEHQASRTHCCTSPLSAANLCEFQLGLLYCCTFYQAVCETQGIVLFGTNWRLDKHLKFPHHFIVVCQRFIYSANQSNLHENIEEHV